ncbi:uncharacterized protein LOC143908167 isoform X2 [Temnothorax americanus]|uniref:uncharacterized protein LOC143908167 isoform X2 n=1 Tax=Temnothorax americanus TaxID=1964332 RepID=UPI004067C913
MYRAVIISCLIAVGCAGIVSPVHHANRETRQATTASTNPAQNLISPLVISGYPIGTPLAETEDNPSFLSSVKPIVRIVATYGLKALGAVFLTTSAIGLFCQYTMVCDSVLADSQSGGRRKRMAHSYSPNEYPYLNELTEILMRAIDDYDVNTANVKQKREVGQ